jgi:hypothetical protein
MSSRRGGSRFEGWRRRAVVRVTIRRSTSMPMTPPDIPAQSTTPANSMAVTGPCAETDGPHSKMAVCVGTASQVASVAAGRHRVLRRLGVM